MIYKVIIERNIYYMNFFDKKNNKNYFSENQLKNISAIHSLFEVEKFLCSFNKAIKCFNIYKLFK